MRRVLLAILISLTIPAHADVTGYVVKAASGTVYLDIVAANGISLGQDFVVFTEGEELKHPVTGASLGHVENQIGKGHIMEIHERYSVGTVELSSAAVKAAAGQKVRMLASFTQSAIPASAPQTSLASSAAPAPSAPTTILGAISSVLSPGPTPGGATASGPVWKSPPIDMEAVEIAIGDIDGDGKPEIILADVNHVYAYPQVGDWKPVCEYSKFETSSKILAIDTADLNKNGRAE